MDHLVIFLNSLGRGVCEYAGSMFVQTTALVAVLLVVDRIIRKRVRAIFRYWMWMLVFVKLLLPPTLALPTGVGYWGSKYIPVIAANQPVGVDRLIQLRISPEAFGPAVCGLLRPTILVPAPLLNRLSPENLRAVLIHELVHIKRRDLWTSVTQTILQVAYFYNPLIWLANAIVRRVREQAVDEMVLVAMGTKARSYSNTLIDIAEMAFSRVSPVLRLIGVAESRRSLEGRIKHMLTRPMPRNAKMRVRDVLVVAVLGAILLPMAAAEVRPSQDVPKLPDGIKVMSR